MRRFATAVELLDFAIGEEEAAAAFYGRLAASMERPWMKKVFEDFAREEQGHKQKLLGVKAGQAASLPADRVQDLKIGEYLIDVQPAPGMDYQQALVLAMKKEKVAFRLYSELAEVATDPSLQALLRSLAQEEARHKLRFEVEYDDQFLKEN